MSRAGRDAAPDRIADPSASVRSDDTTSSHGRPGVVAVVAVVLLLAIALALAWTYTPLARLADPKALAEHARAIRDWPFAPLAVVLLYVVAGFVATPGTLLIAATILLFGPWPGALYAYVGLLANGIVLYAVGRFAARDVVDRWLAHCAESRAGSRAASFGRLLARRGFLAIALMRLSPVPYSLQSVIAGASRIGFVDFVLGTAIGIVPVTLVLAGVMHGLDAALMGGLGARLASLDRRAGLVAAVIAALLIVAGWALRRRLARRQIARPPNADHSQ